MASGAPPQDPLPEAPWPLPAPSTHTWASWAPFRAAEGSVRPWSDPTALSTAVPVTCPALWHNPPGGCPSFKVRNDLSDHRSASSLARPLRPPLSCCLNPPRLPFSAVPWAGTLAESSSRPRLSHQRPEQGPALGQGQSPCLSDLGPAGPRPLLPVRGSGTKASRSSSAGSHPRPDSSVPTEELEPSSPESRCQDRRAVALGP